MIMPVMNGYTTYLRIKDIEPTMPVLLASGYSEEGQASLALQAGATGFVQKPFELQDIVGRLRRILAECS